MKSLRSIASLRRWRFALEPGKPVVLVPTMGALHDGHIALVHRARKIAGAEGSVIASIFVNPTQFGPKEDLSRYPRPLARDLALLRGAGTDAVFLPSRDIMYAQDHSVWVDESFLSTGLCGKSRPGHFRGVCTIVAKLFNCVTPTAAIFGEKDFQQLAIIRRMVRDLDFPIRIVPHPTIREQDGLAMSSRNVYLAPAQRQQAPALHRALASSARRARSSRTTPAQLRKAIATEIAANAPDAQIDYIEVVDAESLTPRPDNMATPGHSRILAAVYFGTTRLIDNVPL